MKIITNIFSTVLCMLLATGCGLDNYDEPQSTLEGRVVYNNQSIGVRGTADAVQVQLYQDGYEKHDPIPIYLTQDGSFKAILFNGQYKLITRSGNGPWLNSTDTIVVNVNGYTTCELPVTPYYTLAEENFSLNGNIVNGSTLVTKVVETSSISSALLLVSKTAFVDEGTYLARQELTDVSEGTLSMSLDLSGNDDAASAVALYARIGVKPAESDQYVYTPVVQIK